jgi:hypothetical protein
MKSGRPRINPDRILTNAERVQRHREKHGERINRNRRERRKVAALLSGKQPESIAHQRIIRDARAISDPGEVVAASLRGYAVEVIDKVVAASLIRKFGWLGNAGRATRFVALYSPKRELHGVACFGHRPAGDIREVIGEPALYLERGACSHHAPRNAASFLITKACKLICRITGTAIFFAYCDPLAGESGRYTRLPAGAISGRASRTRRAWALN